MSKITIREVDETTVGGVVINSTDIVYIPGFSVLDQVDDAEIGLPHVPVLCRTVAEFERYFGVLTPTFREDQLYPVEFDALAIPKDIHGMPQQIMFHKDEPDPSYIEAKELLTSGLQVLYERVNEIGEDPSVEKMYEVLSTVFSKSVDTSLLDEVSFAPPFDTTSSGYSAASNRIYCSHGGQNYKLKTADPAIVIAQGDAWNAAQWDVYNSYSKYSVTVSAPYTFFDTFGNTGKYTFKYANSPSREVIVSGSSASGLASRVALTYNSKSTYALGTKVTYAGNIFKCIEAISVPEKFTSAHWEIVTNWQASSFITFNETAWESKFPINEQTTSPASYVFKYVGADGTTPAHWTYENATTTLDQYGIKVAGEFENDDTITIQSSFVTGWTVNDNETVYTADESGNIACGVKITYEEISGTPDSNIIGDSFTVYLDVADPLLLDRGLYSFKYLTSGGYPVFEYSDNSIEKQMINLCYTRGDAVALIDHTDNPSRALTGTESVDYAVKKTINILPSVTQSFAAMFTPSVEMALINSYIGESYSDSTKIKLKSTGVFPASFAYLSCLAASLKIAPSWNAVAGATRGKVYGLVAPRTTKALTNAIADSYTPDNEVAINPITNIRPYGQCIWGNRTLVDNSIKQGTTATSFLNIRNLVSDVKKQLFVACQSLLFEQNTDVLWVNFLSLVTPVLDKMVSGFGIHNYKIIKLPDSDKTQINVRIRLYPVYAVESFDITIYLNDQGVYLDGEV